MKSKESKEMEVRNALRQIRSLAKLALPYNADIVLTCLIEARDHIIVELRAGGVRVREEETCPPGELQRPWFALWQM